MIGSSASIPAASGTHARPASWVYPKPDFNGNFLGDRVPERPDWVFLVEWSLSRVCEH